MLSPPGRTERRASSLNETGNSQSTSVMEGNLARGGDVGREKDRSIFRLIDVMFLEIKRLDGFA